VIGQDDVRTQATRLNKYHFVKSIYYRMVHQSKEILNHEDSVRFPNVQVD
jgi:hypothetical protein